MQINEKFLKRARAKYFSLRLSLALIEYNPDSLLLNSYKNTLFCNKNLHKVDNKLIGSYCKNRWCLVCNRIRTASLINAYLPELEKFNDAQFVTLTLPTVTEKDLYYRIKEMESAWRLIIELARKKKIGFKGIRKKECTLRPDNYYHYHYHLIIEGRKNAEWLVMQWLKRFPIASPKAQDIRKADERSYKELFKYFTKLVSKNMGRYIDDFRRLDFMFSVLKGVRIFESFGGIRKADENFDDVELQAIFVNTIRGEIWRWVVSDWENEFGDLLTGYKPSEAVLELLSKCPK
ncbi:MAG: protein rep [Bacteroidia bacterium]|nr:protein rep [Bacteroidia bacterium]